MAPSENECFKCNSIIKKGGGSINCGKCRYWFHKKCSDLNTSEFNSFAQEYKKSGHMKWNCQLCIVHEITIIESDVEDEVAVDVVDNSNGIWLPLQKEWNG